ncbi:MAG: carbamate kinase [Leptolyngbyaceae cyanobacterium]
MEVVIALGGNALLQRGQPLEAELQLHNIHRAAQAIAAIAQTHQVIVTHGNGPQVGLLALQAAAYPLVKPYPLDVLNAETEGMIGYLIEQELRNYLPGRQIVTVLTQIEVDAADPAFHHPTKPIGPLYSQTEAEQLQHDRGWAVTPDGEAYRRVVPSPEPRCILELETIQLLVRAGVLVICAGGGGIPVATTATGQRHGVEAVIDKDLAAALLAIDLEVEALLLLTDVDAVYQHWGTPNARPLATVTPQHLRPLPFASGSMAPKVEAACRFVETTGGIAGIGCLEDAGAILAGIRGTRVVAST